MWKRFLNSIWEGPHIRNDDTLQRKFVFIKSKQFVM